MPDEYARTDRTTATRTRDRMRYDRAAAHAVLDEAFDCAVGFVVDGEPRVLPTLHVRVGDTLYLHGSTGGRFGLAARSGQLQEELLAGGYPKDTPCVVAYQVTWPDELIIRTRLDTLAATIKERKLWKHTLVLVGPGLQTAGTRSHLYHPGHFHGYRRAEPQARKQLRDTKGQT